MRKTYSEVAAGSQECDTAIDVVDCATINIHIDDVVLLGGNDIDGARSGGGASERGSELSGDSLDGEDHGDIGSRSGVVTSGEKYADIKSCCSIIGNRKRRNATGIGAGDVAEGC